jgi:hypothetical protein
MATKRAHGHDPYSSIHLSIVLEDYVGFKWEIEVGGGSQHDRKHVGDFGHQQQGQQTQAFASRPHVGVTMRLPKIDCQVITLHYT